MYQSGFTGTIPSGVYKLTKLTRLMVFGNQFRDAPLPFAISNLVNLECVRLSQLTSASA
jgi:hypothetical protein